MLKYYWITMIAAVAMTACTENRANPTVDNADPTNPLSPVEINISGIRFDRMVNSQSGKACVENDTLKFMANGGTDYFHPVEGHAKTSSPIIFTEVDNTKPFTFTAKVEPHFTETGTYSAGVIYAYENDRHYQKLCFEQSEDGLHRVVTVRTVGTSDDNNHQVVRGRHVYMRLSSDGKTLGSYYSEDGQDWHMSRLYKNDFPEKLLLGLSSQSPVDSVHYCIFSDVEIEYRPTNDFRNGKLH